MQNKQGPRNAVRSVSDHLQAFSLFIPNNRISIFHEQFPDLKNIATNKLVDLSEIKAYLGIMYLRAAVNQNLRDAHSIWQPSWAAQLYCYKEFESIFLSYTFSTV